MKASLSLIEFNHHKKTKYLIYNRYCNNLRDSIYEHASMHELGIAHTHNDKY